MKKPKHHHPAPEAPAKRAFWPSLVAVLLYMASAMLAWLIVEGVWTSRFLWMSRSGPGRMIVQADTPGLFWFTIGFHLVVLVMITLGARLLWREAGPTPTPVPRPTRPPNDYPQYRKKKSP